MVSSRRFKHDIKPMGEASEAVLALKPVTFHYNSDPTGAGPQFGLIAEDVEKVNRDLIVRDKEGKPYSVRYEAVNAMLLNEFLKARRQIDAQQKQIDVLTAGLQTLSAQVEASKPRPQVVNNPSSPHSFPHAKDVQEHGLPATTERTKRASIHRWRAR